MGPNSKTFAVGVAIVAVMAAATLLAFAENGEAQWRITPSLSVDKVHFTVRHSTLDGNWVNSRDVPLDRFRGFSLAMLAAPGPAKFEYAADAGRLLCDGRFLVGTGSGTYTFTADSGFVAALQQMGYDTPDDDQLLSMLMMDIDRAFAREIRDSGMRASVRDLIQLRIHGVGLEYIRDARQSGYQNFTADDYTQLRIHGVDMTFLRNLKIAGYDLQAREIAQLRIHGVTSEYMRGLKDAGYGDLRVDQINQLRIHGVDTNFIRESRRLGYDFTPRELAQLRIHGVDARYLQRLQDAGMRNLNAQQIEKLRIHGVD